MTPEPKPYITNAALLRLLEECHATKKCSNELGAAFVLMAERFASKPNFNGYSYTDEMISQATIDCCKSWYKFDMTRKHPFSYFTTVIYHAFVSVIRDEKKQQRVKSLLSIEAGIGERGWKTAPTDHS